MMYFVFRHKSISGELEPADAQGANVCFDDLPGALKYALERIRRSSFDRRRLFIIGTESGTGTPSFLYEVEGG